MRDFARAENPIVLGATRLSSAVANLRPAFPSLDIRAGGDLDTPMRISEDNAAIIFSNLADNAMRHGSSKFDVSAARDGASLRVRVEDDGEGVSPNNRSRIFDSFFTTRRDSGGTGMGLAIIRAMLEAHGGAIRLLESGKGTAFELVADRGTPPSSILPTACWEPLMPRPLSLTDGVIPAQRLRRCRWRCEPRRMANRTDCDHPSRPAPERGHLG